MHHSTTAPPPHQHLPGLSGLPQWWAVSFDTGCYAIMTFHCHYNDGMLGHMSLAGTPAPTAATLSLFGRTLPQHTDPPPPRAKPTRSFSVASMIGCSSGMTTYFAVQGLATASWKNCRIAGPLRSSYTPLLARSLTVTTPKMAGSPILLGLPPDSIGLLLLACIVSAQVGVHCRCLGWVLV